MITKNPASLTLVLHSIAHLDALKAEYYRDQLRPLIDEGYRYLIVDLEGTSQITSSGLGMLVEFYQTLTRLDGGFKLINCSDQVRWLLRQTHLDQMLLGEESEEAPAGGADPEMTQQFDPLHEAMSGEILLLTRLREMIASALKQDDPAEISRSILAGLLGAVESRKGAIFALTQRDERLEVLEWRDEDRPDEPCPLPEYPVKIGKLERTILDGDEIFLHEVQSETTTSDHFFKRLGFQFVMAVPIRGQRRCYGLLMIELGNRTRESAMTVRPLVESSVILAALALEKAALMRMVQEQRDELGATVERLNRRNRALEQSSRLATLGTLLTNLPHQLNNKLMPILGYAQLLQSSADLPEAVQRQAKVIAEASAELQETVNKLVLAGGNREMQMAPVSIAERLEVALDVLAPLMQPLGVRVDHEGLAEDFEMRVDGRQLLQAFMVILHQAACSFAAAHTVEPLVRVFLREHEGKVQLVFEDNGQEPSEEDTQDWLDPMTKPESIKQGRLFNYGIPRAVARRHQGTLHVEGSELGGKRVVLELPMAGRGDQLISLMTPKRRS